jgi:hypothetical protein
MSTVHHDAFWDVLRNIPFLAKKQQFCKHDSACTSNALRGVVRGSVIGYSVKASISLALGLLFKKLYKNPKQILEILLSSDTYSFSIFLGAFSGTYKIVQCLMRLIRQKEDGLNAFVAGSAAGLTLMLDSKSRWLDISLYMFARAVAALLSAYFYGDAKHINQHSESIPNAATLTILQQIIAFIKRFPRTILSLLIGNADVILFATLVGILLLGFIYEPWNLSPSYYKVFTRMEKASGDEHVAHNYRLAYRKCQGMEIDPNDLQDKRIAAPARHIQEEDDDQEAAQPAARTDVQE